MVISRTKVSHHKFFGKQLLKEMFIMSNESVESHDQDHMLTPVPKSERRPTWKQVMVWVGFGYVVTGMFVDGVLS